MSKSNQVTTESVTPEDDQQPEVVTQESDLITQIDELKAQLVQAQENELRSRADYHNVVRRNQEQTSRLMKLAARDVLSSLLQPLDHLSMAATQLKDKGLDMVVDQLWKALAEQGLQELDVMGKPFDAVTMEVVDKKSESDQVTAVVRKGYQLNGEVIQHAKVIVG